MQKAISFLDVKSVARWDIVLIWILFIIRQKRVYQKLSQKKLFMLPSEQF